MDGSSRLQIPDYSPAGPSQTSRTGSSSRPASANVITTLNAPSSQVQSAHPSSRKRASHNVTTAQQQPPEVPIYRDVYSHPAAVAYAAAHPKRTIPKFGPYLLLQTLGEGEFGKVKLGLHGQWGEEVAVKLIRRGNIDTQVRMSKVEREIEVLRTIKHPNIVRLYDVIETDKYIGIILEYASGGELFDHILAHRYLKERDACKLFAQLVSGVWYIHQKKIVHRDLKLENLLLDRQRNVIITDFGFANRFEHRPDDLMQTSCGSPCYAAPELVISEGLYVGSAVDIWSCGVILYAMLAGYLPFDDDPANPDGDNINLLYKYIVNTPLTFPDYVSMEARDLLSIMLVPDPQHRADLDAIMAHVWLKPYVHLFERSVADLERAAVDQHQVKRMAYQRQMKQQAAASTTDPRMQRSLSARTDTPASNVRAKALTGSATHPELLYESAMDESLYSPPAPVVQTSSRRHAASAVVMPSSARGRPLLDDDPFAATPYDTARPGMGPMPIEDTTMEEDDSRRHTIKPSPATSPRKAPQPAVASTPEKRKADRQRHTIQLEYGGEADDAGPMPSNAEQVVHQQRTGAGYLGDMEDSRRAPSSETKPIPPSPAHSRQSQRRASAASEYTPTGKPQTPSSTISKGHIMDNRMTSPPSATKGSVSPFSNNFIWSQQNPAPPTVSMTPASPPKVQEAPAIAESNKVVEERRGNVRNGSTGSSSSASKHRKGISVDKFVGKIWGNGSDAVLAPGNVSGTSSRVPSDGSFSGLSGTSPTYGGYRSPVESGSFTEKGNDGKKSTRRNTLTVMVEPFSRQIKQRSKGRSATGDVPAQSKEKDVTATPTKLTPRSAMPPPATPNFTDMSTGDTSPLGIGVPASTNKASKVMQWFRSKSKGGRTPSEVMEDFENVSHDDVAGSVNRSIVSNGTYKENSSNVGQQAPVQVVVTTPTPGDVSGTYGALHSISHPSPSMISDTSNPSSPNANLHTRAFTGIANGTGSTAVNARGTFNKAVLRVHHGAVDHDMVVAGYPPDVMSQVTKVLVEMGLEVQQESEFKFRCLRHKRKKFGGSPVNGGLTAFTMVGSAASNGVDKRGLPVPSSFGTGGMLRGLLMRRQSSQVSASGALSHISYDSDVGIDNSSREVVSPLPSSVQEPIFGDKSRDQGNEVRLFVELTRIDGLHDTYCLDIRRLKGSLRSYKFLYDTIRVRCDLQRYQ